jgi:hypothetical protein
MGGGTREILATLGRFQVALHGYAEFEIPDSWRFQ